MTDDVGRLIAGLDQAPDVNPHWRVTDRWVGEENEDRLRELAVALLGMGSGTRPWQPASLLEHLRGRVASTPGRWGVGFLLDRLIIAGMPVRQLREAAARIASAQEPEVIVAVLEGHEGETELSEFLYVLTHEAVLRRKLDENTSIAVRLSDRMRHEGHPLAHLPLGLLDLETEVPALLPHYGPQESSVFSTGVSEDREESPQIPAGSGPVPHFKDVTSPETAERAATVVRAWCEGSNGLVEARMFDFDGAIPARTVGPTLLRSFGLESLTGAGEEDIRLWAITPARGFGHRFSAAVTGGAYAWGEGGAYGRLAAWESLGALIGCPVDDPARASSYAGRCSWFSFEAESEWFYNIAWDFALAVLSPDGRSLAILAATDTD